ncbi:Mov34/MPN/PAD-1 family protein [Papillibacter cinnamivorans]|nr:Mov34/MPN/PAD-1 family protein [Papillibacter cinnamivorans]
MIFKYDDKLTVELSPDVVKLNRICMLVYDYQNESGGILVGVMKDGSHLTITNVTEPQLRDRKLPFRFLRSGSGHQEYMDQFWEQSGYQKMYFGEWHTHREDYPIPSTIDTCGWKKIAKKKQNSPWMLFIILGLKSYRLWTVDKGIIKELVQHAE